MTGTDTPHADRAVPVGVDPTRASIARVYDAALGGKDNYEIDRRVVAQANAAAPGAFLTAVENRKFLIRALRFVAEQTGLAQYLDCGSGLPTAENTHQVVQRINPEARVVYVDNDPVVLAHGRALLEDNELTRMVDADIYTPRDVLENAAVRNHLDLSRPTALLQAATLHVYAGEKDPADIMAEYIDALPSGSYVVFSHFFDPEDEYGQSARSMEQAMLHSPMGSGRFRTHAELLRMLAGLELIEPGLVRCADWWPDGPRLAALEPMQHCIAGAVARKP